MDVRVEFCPKLKDDAIEEEAKKLAEQKVQEEEEKARQQAAEEESKAEATSPAPSGVSLDRMTLNFLLEFDYFILHRRRRVKSRQA